MKAIALVLGLTCATLGLGQCRFGKCGSFNSPFQIQGSSRNWIPLTNTPRSRTIAVNGVAVPPGAIGYTFQNGQLEWVFGGSQNFDPRASTPNSGQSTHGGNSPSQNRIAGDSGRTAPRPIVPEGGVPQLPSGTPNNSSTRGLVPANTNGNPGFAFSVAGPGFSENCQGTLISAVNGTCLVATASHCLKDAIRRSDRSGSDTKALSGAACSSETQQRGVIWGQGKIKMADFGEVEALMFENPEYDGGTRSEDSGVFSFKCSNPPKDIPVVAIGSKPLSDGENVSYGKVMGGKAGLYQGVVWRQPGVVGINSRPVGEAQESVMQNEQVAIQQGDSGGGVYRTTPTGEKELVGILSTSDDVTRRLPLGNYATNKSLEFLRCVKERFSQGGAQQQTLAATQK